MGVLLYAVFIGSVNLKCLFLKHAKKAIVTAVNYGGDADTIGAITGGLIGARKGIDSIPKEWLAALPKDICRRIDAFADFCANAGA